MGSDFDVCIQDVKKKLILNNQLYGFESEHKGLLQIVKKTTDFGESDSVIILGPRGCGKTTVIYEDRCFNQNMKCELMSSFKFFLIYS